MSGGSYNYTYWKVESEYVGNMHDDEMNDMIEDIVKILHDVEWWQSDDISENDYRTTVERFKTKWLGKRDQCLRLKIAEKLEKAKMELLE